MFEIFSFTQGQLQDYYNNALEDFQIAQNSHIPKVVFKFCYDALLKFAIFICAKNNLRVKSRQGHHVELLNKMAEILNNMDIKVIGNEIRNKRNIDLYSGGGTITKKEAKEYMKWLESVVSNINS